MANTVLHKRSSSSGVVPAYTALTAGELAVNSADGHLFTKKGTSDVVTFIPTADLTGFVGGVMQGGGGITVSTVAGDYTQLTLANYGGYSNAWVGGYTKVAEGYINGSLQTVLGTVGGTSVYNTTLTLSGTGAGEYTVDNALSWYVDSGGVARTGINGGYDYMAYSKSGAYVMWDNRAGNYRLFIGTMPAADSAASGTFYSATSISYAEYTGVFATGRRIAQGGASWTISWPTTGGNWYGIYRRADSAYTLIYTNYGGLNRYIVALGDWSSAGSHGSLSYSNLGSDAGVLRTTYYSPTDGAHTSYSVTYVQSINVTMPSSLDAGTY